MFENLKKLFRNQNESVENENGFPTLVDQYHADLNRLQVETLYSTTDQAQLKNNQITFDQNFPLISIMHQATENSNTGEVIIKLKDIKPASKTEVLYLEHLLTYFNIINSWERGTILYQPIQTIFAQASDNIIHYQANNAKTKWVMQKGLPKLLKKLDKVVESQYATDNYSLQGYHQRYSDMMKLPKDKLMEKMFKIGVNQYLLNTLLPNLNFLNEKSFHHTEYLVNAIFKTFNQKPTTVNFLSLLSILKWLTNYQNNVDIEVSNLLIISNFKQLKLDDDILSAYFQTRSNDLDAFMDNADFNFEYSEVDSRDYDNWRIKSNNPEIHYNMDKHNVYYELNNEFTALAKSKIAGLPMVKSTVYQQMKMYPDNPLVTND